MSSVFLQPIDKDVVFRKLAKLVEYLRELEGKKDLTFEEYMENKDIMRATERLLQLVVEVMTDINAMLITGVDAPPPRDYYTSFTRLGELGIIEEDMAQNLAPCSGLRNRLVHEYEHINDQIVYASIDMVLRKVPNYMRAIKAFIQNE
jgi:uncharacterized protein YutE (UPF0331/DUF86 family)